jgi:hypothetical protein
VSGVMANPPLHHIVELERLFATIDRCLILHRHFVTNDMIGKGHMRWPETSAFVQALWKVLPKDKKYHHQLKQYRDEFMNHDCSRRLSKGLDRKTFYRC